MQIRSCTQFQTLPRSLKAPASISGESSWLSQLYFPAQLGSFLALALSALFSPLGTHTYGFFQDSEQE